MLTNSLLFIKLYRPWYWVINFRIRLEIYLFYDAGVKVLLLLPSLRPTSISLWIFGFFNLDICMMARSINVLQWKLTFIINSMLIKFSFSRRLRATLWGEYYAVLKYCNIEPHIINIIIFDNICLIN